MRLSLSSIAIRVWIWDHIHVKPWEVIISRTLTSIWMSNHSSLPKFQLIYVSKRDPCIIGVCLVCFVLLPLSLYLYQNAMSCKIPLFIYDIIALFHLEIPLLCIAFEVLLSGIQRNNTLYTVDKIIGKRKVNNVYNFNRFNCTFMITNKNIPKMMIQIKWYNNMDNKNRLHIALYAIDV